MTKAFCEDCQSPQTVQPAERDENGVLLYRFDKHARATRLQPVPSDGDAPTTHVGPCEGGGKLV